MESKAKATLNPSVVVVHPAMMGAAILAEEAAALMEQEGFKRATRQLVLGTATARATRRIKEVYHLEDAPCEESAEPPTATEGPK
jgi:hypothetical protein